MMARCTGWRKTLPRRNPLSIQVCFNKNTEDTMTYLGTRRNPLSIQVCFNGTGSNQTGRTTWVVIPYQFRSVSIPIKFVEQS